MDDIVSFVTEVHIQLLRDAYNILESIGTRPLAEEELPSEPSPGHVTLFIDFFHSDLHLLFHPFIQEALVDFNLAPGQLSHNLYQYLIRQWVMHHMDHYPDISFEEFKAR